MDQSVAIRETLENEENCAIVSFTLGLWVIGILVLSSNFNGIKQSPQNVCKDYSLNN